MKIKYNTAKYNETKDKIDETFKYIARTPCADELLYISSVLPVRRCQRLNAHRKKNKNCTKREKD